MKRLLFLLLLLPLSGFAQSLYTFDPQLKYDNPGEFYDQDSLRNLDINFLDPNYHSVLQNSFFTDPSYRIPATVTLNGVAYDSVGVRYKGNSTFCIPNDNGNPKVPYNLDMNHFVSGQKLMNYKKVKLANAFMDATFCRELAASKIYRKYLPTTEVNLTTLNVQGNYLGLFASIESVNKQFMQKHFGEKDGVLFKCDGSGMFCDTTGTPPGGEPNLQYLGADSAFYYTSYNLKSESGWQELMELIVTLDSNPSQLDSVLNVDRVLWAFAVNTVLANYDTYNSYYVHNYYFYKTEDGLFQMIPWDLSQTFLNALLAFDIFGGNDPTTMDPYTGIDPADGRPLTEFLFTDPRYRNQYNAHIRTIMNELDTAGLRQHVYQAQAMANSAAAADQNKMFSMADYGENVENDIGYLPWGGYGFGGIMSTIEGRLQFLGAHAELNLAPPSISNIAVQNGFVTADVSNETSVDLMATISAYSSKFQTFTMYDDGTNGDAAAGDGQYTAPLPFATSGENVKFYIRGQNAQAMMLSPQRAEYEFYLYGTLTGVLDSPVEDAVLSIYPNPTNSMVTVETDFSKATAYEVFSIVGERLMTGMITSNRQQIDLSQLPANVYFLRVGDHSHKIVKTD
jgi:spore coat protein CotH